MTIVIVEDEIKIRNGLNRLLSSYENINIVGKAKNGAEGLSLIDQLRPDLVFTDIKMPEMDGLEMLENLRAKDIHCHCVLLTGYAEFDFAKRAISCGADDYLLKPITVEAIENVITSIDSKLRSESAQLEATPGSYLRALISGTIESTDENVKKASMVFGIDKSSILCLAHGYCSSAAFNVSDYEGILEKHGGIYVSENGKDCYILFVMNSSSYSHDFNISDMIRNRLKIMSKNAESIWYVEELNSLFELHTAAQNSDKKLLYSLAFPTKTIITKDDISTANLYEYSPSSDIEKRIEHILVESSEALWSEWINSTKDAILKGHYEPDSVKGAFINISNYILQLSAKLWPEKNRQLRELDSAIHIGKARTLDEMFDALTQQAKILLSHETQRESIQNYTILKAITYIREHYAERISQEEVASFLSITPEYLSTLFNREINKNFAAFVNEFRISHSKRLLNSTNLKIYEIAEKVGFTDPKYFNKVFKDIVGISPKEFRGR